jgi:hypothetical protein
MVSPAYLASESIRSSEIPVLLRNARESGVVIIPVILRPCLFEETRFRYPDPQAGPDEFSLASLRAANAPSRPLSSLSESEQDEVLLGVARTLLQLLGPTGAPVAAGGLAAAPADRKDGANTTIADNPPFLPSRRSAARRLILFTLSAAAALVAGSWFGLSHHRTSVPAPLPSLQSGTHAILDASAHSADAAQPAPARKVVPAPVSASAALKYNDPSEVVAGTSDDIPTFEAVAAIQPTRVHFAPTKKVKLMQFEVYGLQSPYEKTQIGFAAAGKRITTYMLPLDYGQSVTGNAHPIFVVSLENTTDREILLTGVLYRVEKVGQVSGGRSGPMGPEAMYVHTIHWKDADQIAPLIPAFRLAAKSAGSFLLQLRPKEADVGMAWLMRVVFLLGPNEGVASERFQLIMTAARS